MSHPYEWNVLVSDRIAEILGTDYTVDTDDDLVYEWRHGYERLEVSHEHGGGLMYTGSYHPGDGLCHAKPDVVDASSGICVHCGRTLM